MPRMSDREIREELGQYFDEEDDALIRHVLCEDEIPQGLHRGGMKPDTIRAIEHGYDPELERQIAEADIFWDWKFPEPMHDDGGFL